jgi:large subunit ribosomal protein L32e
MAEKTERKPSQSRKALKIRARSKNKKPKFVRAESWKYDRFSTAWRRPRGLDNKIRRKIKGWPPAPSMGYKGPKIARGLHPSGYREVIVYNAEDLFTLDSTTQAARIAHTVGKRKRASIISQAKELNIKILNVKVSAEPEIKEEAEEGEEQEGKAKEKEIESETDDKEQLKKEKIEKKKAASKKKKKSSRKSKPKLKQKKGKEKQ